MTRLPEDVGRFHEEADTAKRVNKWRSQWFKRIESEGERERERDSKPLDQRSVSQHPKSQPRSYRALPLLHKYSCDATFVAGQQHPCPHGAEREAMDTRPWVEWSWTVLAAVKEAGRGRRGGTLAGGGGAGSGGARART